MPKQSSTGRRLLLTKSSGNYLGEGVEIDSHKRRKSCRISKEQTNFWDLKTMRLETFARRGERAKIVMREKNDLERVCKG